MNKDKTRQRISWKVKELRNSGIYLNIRNLSRVGEGMAGHACDVSVQRLRKKDGKVGASLVERGKESVC